MKTRTLGKSGPEVSLVGLGCNNFGWYIDLEAARAVVHKALDSGITLFDTADIYAKWVPGHQELLPRHRCPCSATRDPARAEAHPMSELVNGLWGKSAIIRLMPVGAARGYSPAAPGIPRA